MALFAAVSSLWTAAAFAQTAEPQRAADFRLPRGELTAQTDTPFTRLKVIERGHPQWDRYRRSIARYPDTLSCLVEEVRDEPEPDLLAFDWRGITREQDYEVCLFRVFSSLGSVHRARDWMAASGMRVAPVGTPGATGEPGSPFVTGYWSFEEAAERSNVAGNVIERTLNRMLSPSYSFYVSFSDAGEVTVVNITPITR